MASTDSYPIAKKNTAFRLYFYIEDENGDPVTGFTSPDSEVSKDGAAYADCTNEATFVGHGGGYIDLTSSEMNADAVSFHMSCTEGHFHVEIAPAENSDIPVDLRAIGGDAQSATDLKDFSDVGYDPSLHHVVDVLNVGFAEYVNSLSEGAVSNTSFATGAIDAAAIATSAVTEIQSGLATAANLATLSGYVDTEVAAIKAKTDNLPASPANEATLTTIAGYLDTEIAAILADTDELQQDWHDGGRLDLLLDARAAASALAAVTGTGGVLIGTEANLYKAHVNFTVDGANTQDEYTVTWYKNGVPVTSGITTPLIQVVKRSNGADLVASVALTQIASTGTYKLDVTEFNERLTEGESALVIVTATIDGAARSDRTLVSRDSE